MFKFLKKRLKKFEDKLEEELEQEIKKDTSSETKETKQEQSVEEPKQTPEQPLQESLSPQPSEKPIETAREEKPKEGPTKPQPLTPRERRRRRREAKKQRDEKTDKQIEDSLKAELDRTYQTRQSISKSIQKDTASGKKISEEKLDDLLWELEIGLLESDVAYDVIESIKKDIKEELRKVPLKRGTVNETVEKVLRHAISHVLESNKFNFNDFIKEKEKPVVVMFVGVNGSGKTLSIAKMATLLQQKGYSSVMAAGDTFRAGAIEQLGIHADKIGVKIIKHGPGADPAAVAYDAIEHAKAKHKDVVLLDTAGRMQTNVNLMDEMAKIKRVAQPNLILFVGDALAGNDAVEQAKRFNEIVGIDGVILTKVDTDAKGGSALSVAYTIGKPLLFIGIGQKYDEQIPFDSQWMIDNIFGK
ncbi:MAG: signal recognition particle-docking protein FtsY [Candidatus Thermoplasmatota archaeon]|nr:signal recognition particle-docking protein FtsY [Candidatus Thermoplasmatota archaeon]MBS3801666.1 signal recognition particle-docking protein FtsY [Candidatus Thermoplasmatota archaeon]